MVWLTEQYPVTHNSVILLFSSPYLLELPVCRWASAAPYAPSWFNSISHILIAVFGHYLKENPWELNLAPLLAISRKARGLQ